MYFYYKSNLRIVKRGKTNFAIFAIFYRERLKTYFFPVLDSFLPLLFFPTFVGVSPPPGGETPKATDVGGDKPGQRPPAGG